MKTSELIAKSKCCGCGLCKDVCPHKAIIFIEEELGVLYPHIDESKCVGCGACVRMCPAQKQEDSSCDEQVYFAAINRDEQRLRSSASGGVFSALAENILDDSGVVYGASMIKDEGDVLKVKHLRIESKDELCLLQGSKYVQSDMTGVYLNVKKDIKAGKKVLFSGTPCQVAAVKMFCGSPENLLLVEVICHGVPSQRLFTEYLHTLKKKKSAIEAFSFRSKESGWGLCAKITTKNKVGKRIEKRIPCNISSFYKMFLKCEIYRKSCYQCKYATKDRIADLTIGDYWGIEKDAVVYSKIQSLGYKVTEGISCVIVTSLKGMNFLKRANIELVATTYESISRENGQLVHSSKCPDTYGGIVDEYVKGGYWGLDKKFTKTLGVKKYVIVIKNKIPPQVRFAVKKMLKK